MQARGPELGDSVLALAAVLGAQVRWSLARTSLPSTVSWIGGGPAGNAVAAWPPIATLATSVKGVFDGPGFSYGPGTLVHSSDASSTAHAPPTVWPL